MGLKTGIDTQLIIGSKRTSLKILVIGSLQDLQSLK